jgi:hypothetical protein
MESFTESQKTFQINISGKHDIKETTGEDHRLVELSAVNKEGLTDHIILIRIMDGERDLYDPKYEASFLVECKCAILERGSVPFAGRPARHYTVALKNGEWIGFQRHFTGKGRSFHFSVSGPKENAKNLRVIFDQIILNFHLLDK